MLVEESASGAWNGRPGLVRVLDAARAGEVDAVVVWKLDRWGRSALDVLANIRALADAGVRFVAVTQGLDVKPDGDAMSRLMLTVLAAVAEFERDLIRERTRLGLDRARAAGTRLGRPRVDGPSPAAVRRLRKRERSWSDVAAELHCTVATARRRATERS
jgi:DNA invertase Pin-like site-specific DNA recombinase